MANFSQADDDVPVRQHEIETKLNVLNAEFSLNHNRNPFESIKAGSKTPESIGGKNCSAKIARQHSKHRAKTCSTLLESRHLLVPEECYVVRVYCSSQDDPNAWLTKRITFAAPSQMGTAACHLIVEGADFSCGGKTPMKVEVQLRTK